MRQPDARRRFNYLRRSDLGGRFPSGWYNPRARFRKRQNVGRIGLKLDGGQHPRERY